MHSSDLWTEEAGLLDVTCRNPDRWISRINCRLFYIFDYFSSRQFSSRAEFLREIFDHLPFGGGVTSARTRRLVAAGARNCLLIAVISACAGTKGVNPNDNPHQGRAQKCWICRAVLRVGLA